MAVLFYLVLFCALNKNTKEQWSITNKHSCLHELQGHGISNLVSLLNVSLGLNVMVYPSSSMLLDDASRSDRF